MARLSKTKNQYERRRSADWRPKAGTIEADFSAGALTTRLFDPFSTLLGQAPVLRTSSLDEVLRDGEVPMVASPALTSLESLLGVSRKFSPRNLPRRRAGRKTMYRYDALLCCMTASLDAKRWLVDASDGRLCCQV